MVRKLEPGRLVIASHNPGKVVEIRDLVSSFKVEPVCAADLNLPEPEETGATFIDNARLKALAAATGASLPALADDSGLCVDALGGAPGIYSARWAGPGRDFGLAMKRVTDELDAAQVTAEKRTAHFVCALCLAWPDGHTEVFEGKVFGRLVWPARGTQGFGYDPIFIADGQSLTFGEMEPNRKHTMSHRYKAFRQLVAACLG